MRFSPQGELLALDDHVPNGDDGRVVIVDREGNHRAASSFYSTVLGLAWAPNGHEVWFTASPAGAARALYAMDLAGKERLVLRIPGNLVLQDIGRNGRILIAEDNAQFGVMALAPGESRERNLSWFDWSIVTAMSPDGKEILFSESGEGVGTHYSVFLRKTDGAPAIRLGEGNSPVFSPDGKSILATTNSSVQQLETLPIGAGQRRVLTNDNIDRLRVGWLPNGKEVVFSAVEPGHGLRFYVQSVEGGAARAITTEGLAWAIPVISPDGKYLLTDMEGGQHFLFPIEGGDPQPLSLKLQQDERVIEWDPDGKTILVATSGMPAKISRMDLASGRRRELRQIAPSDPAGIQYISNLCFSADTKSYTYSYYRVLSDLYVVDGLK